MRLGDRTRACDPRITKAMDAGYETQGFLSVLRCLERVIPHSPTTDPVRVEVLTEPFTNERTLVGASAIIQPALNLIRVGA